MISSGITIQRDLRGQRLRLEDLHASSTLGAMRLGATVPPPGIALDEIGLVATGN